MSFPESIHRDANCKYGYISVCWVLCHSIRHTSLGIPPCVCVCMVTVVTPQLWHAQHAGPPPPPTHPPQPKHFPPHWLLLWEGGCGMPGSCSVNASGARAKTMTQECQPPWVPKHDMLAHTIVTPLANCNWESWGWITGSWKDYFVPPYFPPRGNGLTVR